jgi:hypothetical protein
MSDRIPELTPEQLEEIKRLGPSDPRPAWYLAIMRKAMEGRRYGDVTDESDGATPAA